MLGRSGRCAECEPTRGARPPFCPCSIWRTKDGGTTWQDASNIGTAAGFNAVLAWGTAASHRVLVGGYNGALMLRCGAGNSLKRGTLQASSGPCLGVPAC